MANLMNWFLILHFLQSPFADSKFEDSKPGGKSFDQIDEILVQPNAKKWTGFRRKTCSTLVVGHPFEYGQAEIISDYLL